MLTVKATCVATVEKKYSALRQAIARWTSVDEIGDVQSDGIIIPDGDFQVGDQVYIIVATRTGVTAEELADAVIGVTTTPAAAE